VLSTPHPVLRNSGLGLNYAIKNNLEYRWNCLKCVFIKLNNLLFYEIQIPPSHRINQLISISRPCKSLVSMSAITPPQHAQKASTLPQASQPPTRKPRKLKNFFRRLSHSPKPKDDVLTSTVSAQSLEAILTPTNRSRSETRKLNDSCSPEKRKSSFGNFLSAFTRCDRPNKKTKGKKKSRGLKMESEEVYGVPVTTVPSLSPMTVKVGNNSKCLFLWF